MKLSRTSLCLPDFCFSTTGAATGAEAGEAVLTAFAAEARAAGGRAALEAAGERRGILAAISGSFVEMEIPFIRYGIRLASPSASLAASLRFCPGPYDVARVGARTGHPAGAVKRESGRCVLPEQVQPELPPQR